MRKIINQVQSPFIDENVKLLIKQYISWDGEFSGFYRMINSVDESDRNMVLSEKDYLKIPDNHKERSELYRIYLNLKGQDKAKMIAGYVQKCKEEKKGYKFKYSKKDGRNDEIVIITDTNNFQADINIIKQVTQELQLGKPPELVGIYENGIGIAEEYIEAPIYSYTEVRLDFIPKAIAKYILDNAIEFIEYCDDKQVKLIDDIRTIFSRRIKFVTYELNMLPEESEKTEQIEKEKTAYEQNINLGHIGFGVHITVVRELLEPLRKYMSDNSEKAFHEMVQNYRAVCKAHGISEQGVFSLRTEQKINGDENGEKTLLELEQEFQRLKKQEQRTKQQRDENKLLRNAYKTELEQREQVC